MADVVLNGYGFNHELPFHFSIGAESFATWTALVAKAVKIIKDFEGVPLSQVVINEIQHKLDNMFHEAKANRSFVLISYEKRDGKVFKELTRFIAVGNIELGLIQIVPVWEER